MRAHLATPCPFHFTDAKHVQMAFFHFSCNLCQLSHNIQSTYIPHAYSCYRFVRQNSVSQDLRVFCLSLRSVILRFWAPSAPTILHFWFNWTVSVPITFYLSWLQTQLQTPHLLSGLGLGTVADWWWLWSFSVCSHILTNSKEITNTGAGTSVKPIDKEMQFRFQSALSHHSSTKGRLQVTL